MPAVKPPPMNSHRTTQISPPQDEANHINIPSHTKNPTIIIAQLEMVTQIWPITNITQPMRRVIASPLVVDSLSPYSHMRGRYIALCTGIRGIPRRGDHRLFSQL